MTKAKSAETRDENADETRVPVCFVIMPIADPDSYSVGHFKRVYEFIIRPARARAGFVALRADEINQTNHIVLDVLRRIVESQMAIGDLSSRNPNVFYEIGMRQAFNLPLTLIKDTQTARVFDIQGLRDIEYNPSLRIDAIEPTINLIAESLKNTHASASKNGLGHINSIVELLGIAKAEIPQSKELSGETALILESLNQVRRRLDEIDMDYNQLFRARRRLELPEIGAGIRLERAEPASLEATGEHLFSDETRLAVGSKVRHPQYGLGAIVAWESRGRVKVQFETNPNETRTFVFSKAPLTPIAN